MSSPAWPLPSWRSVGMRDPGWYSVQTDGSSPGNFNLNSAFVYGISGVAMAQTWIVENSGDVEAIWICVSNYVGDWTATDQKVTVMLRKGITALNNIQPANTTLLGTVEVDLTGSPTGWIRVATPAGMTVGQDEAIWMIVGDPDGGATNYVSLFGIVRSLGTFGSHMVSTTNGFSTVGASNTYPSRMAVKVAGTMYGGGLLAVTRNYTASVRMRGWKINALPFDMAVVGVGGTAYGNSPWNIYIDETTPLTTPAISWGIVSTSNYTIVHHGYRLFRPGFVLRRGKTYRVVAAPTGNVSQYFHAANSDIDAELQTLLPWGGKIHGTVQSAVGSDEWTDEPTLMPALNMTLMLAQADAYPRASIG